MTGMLAAAIFFLGIVGAFIAFMQWKTAQQKVVLDISKVRFEIYEQLIQIAGEFAANAKFPPDLHARFFDAQRRARFHFGAEVDEYLEALRRDMVKGDYFDRVGHRADVTEDQYVGVFERINTAYVELDRLFVPYMRNDQKMPLW